MKTKRLFILSLVFIFIISLASCKENKKDNNKDNNKDNYSPYVLKPDADTSLLGGSPWLDLSRDGAIDMVERPELKNDFFNYVNYDEFKELELGDHLSVGGIIGKQEDILKELNNIYKKPSNSNYSNIIMDLYSKYINENKSIEKSYIKGKIDKILEQDTEEKLSSYMKSEEAFNTPAPLFNVVKVGDKEIELIAENDLLSFKYVTSIYDYAKMYGNEADIFNSIVKCLTECGYSDQDANFIVEKALEEAEEIVFRRYSADDTVGDIDIKYDGIKNILNSMGYTDDYCISNNEVYNLLYHFFDENMRYYYAARLAFAYKWCYGSEFIQELFNTLNSGLGGSASSLTYTDKDVINNLYFSYTISDLTNKIYADNYIPYDNFKNDIESFVEDVKNGYVSLLESNDWMDEYSKAYAIEKLNAMKYSLLYPEYLDYLPNISFEYKNFAEAYGKLNYWRSLANQPVKDDYSWSQIGIVSMTNAFNNRSENMFYLCLGLVYDIDIKDMSKEELYGTIGTIIGHEISHSFDSIGSTYDKDGRFDPWMSDETQNNFKKLYYKVEMSYNFLKAAKAKPVNGLLVVDEAIADLGGISVMLNLAKNESDFDYSKFFESYAKMYCSKHKNSEALYRSLLNDQHPLDMIRVNHVVRQFDKFYATYDIKPGDVMYVKPEERVTIW